MSGEDLRGRRNSADISVGRVAEHIHMDVSYLCKIERGERPMPEGFAEQYEAALRAIGTQVAQAVGLEVIAA